MSFAIKLKNGKCMEWHVPYRKPPEKIDSDIILFQADGEELQYIRRIFNNIPLTEGNFCKWNGEMAKFIFDNL